MKLDKQTSKPAKWPLILQDYNYARYFFSMADDETIMFFFHYQ